MSPRYHPNDVDEVRARADIVEVISEHVRLKRSGRSYKGLCPFHQEKTPSFTVDREKGLYYCHGCNAGGSVFTFLERVENLSFAEAVEALARRYGVELREVPGARRAESPKARLLGLHEATVELYRQWLEAPDAGPVRAYLDERGMGPEVRARYAIGFGGWARDGLVRTLLRKGHRGEELLEAGLATREGRAMRDTFWGRVVFPIFDPSSRPVGFGGRVLPEPYRRPGAPEAPKYLNSRETPVFRKSRVLYGLNWARGEVMRAKRLVLVEGYTDVIALHGAGVGEAAATCGTALTEQHMQEISRRFGDVRVVLCLDADTAGQAAVARERTEELAGAYSPGEAVVGGWVPVGRGWLPEVYVAALPEGKDPADFVRAGGAAGIAEVLDGAVPLVEFLLRRALQGLPLRSPADRARAVRVGAEVLAQVGDSLLRHEYALWLADRVGVEPFQVTRPAQGSSPALSGPHRVEREALRALVAWPGLLREEQVGEEDFTLPVHRAVFRLLAGDAGQEELDVARLADRVQEEGLRQTLTELAVGQPPEEGAAREILVRLKEFTVGRQIEQCKGQLRKLDPEREAAAYDALFERLLSLERERRLLKQRR